MLCNWFKGMHAHPIQAHIPSRQIAPFADVLYRLGSEDDLPDGGQIKRPSNPAPTPREDLPYKVELWDDARTAVEQVLAVTAHGSIGYAAYYAATREFPSRYITLRHNNNIVSRWNGSGH